MRRTSVVGRGVVGFVVGLAALAGLASRSRGEEAPAKPPAAPAKAAATFPEAWRGHWKGPSRVVGPAGTTMTFTMELVIEPTETAGRWTWTVIYDGAAGRQVRPYHLVAVDAAKGAWKVDEGNGIEIVHQVLDGTLFAQFAVGGARITTRERLEGAGTPDERLEVEMMTTRDGDAAASGGGGTIPTVQSWPPRSLQTATLRR
ncbi:MAG: hypothetical protein JNM10_15065 [Planctomycetia bacterium]|nr:hypothetical protein [Planctomycetia bacterium]